MTWAPESADDSAGEIVERLADETPALLLLRYRAASLPAHLAARLKRHSPNVTCSLLSYRPDAEEGSPGSASDITSRCASSAGPGQTAVLLLVPQYPEGSPLPPHAAARFWKSLNAQRETLGQLNARVLLCIDPGQEPYASAHARDLLSWCAPKFTLFSDILGDAESALDQRPSNLAEQSRAEGQSDKARLERRALVPLWDELLASGRPPTPAEVERLGLPLLESALQDGDLEEAERLAHTIAATNLPPRSRPHGVWLLLQGRLAHARGRFDEAKAFYEEALRLYEGLLQESPQDLRAKRNIAITLNQFATLLVERGELGDFDQAALLLERDLRLSEQILEATPDSAQAARDVAIGLSKLGEILVSRSKHGDSDKALAYFQRSLSLRERSLAANPDSAEVARDVSVCLNVLGDFLASRGLPGDSEKAFAYFQRDLELSERLLAANPGSAQAARDVSVSLNKLGNFLALRGRPSDFDAALAHFQRSLELSERLLVANPNSAQAARDVFVSSNYLGDFLASRGLPGDAEKALACFQRGLALTEGLLAANSGSAQTTRDVAVGLNALGDFLLLRAHLGDSETALAHFQRGLDITERLFTANPDSAVAARDVLISLERMAKLSGEQPDGAEKALELQKRSLEIALKLRNQNPRSWFYQRTAAVSYVQAAQRAHDAGNEELAKQYWASCFSVLDPLVQAGAEIDPPMRRLHARLASLFSQRSSS